MKRTMITIILTLVFSAFAIQAVEQTAFSGAGIIESSNGGFKFPDGTMQLSAANPPCTAITYLPFVINDEGIYCLTGHLETSITSGHAIEIQADNVIIELNGWKLDGSMAGSETQATGIYAYERKNVIVKNGTIRGFFTGVALTEANEAGISEGYRVEHINAINNFSNGIFLQGEANIIRHNEVLNTGGSALAPVPAAIISIGAGSRIIDNDIVNVTAPVLDGSNQVWGLYIAYGNGSVVEGNRIHNIRSDDGTAEIAIIIILSDNVLVVGNRLSDSSKGIEFIASNNGKYMDNLTAGVTTPFNGGLGVGTNN